MKSDSEKKKIRARALRNRRALLNEKKKFGWYNDGGGKRYRIGVDLVAAGDFEEALKYFRWFETEFSDDVGEPVFLLNWALAEYRSGHAAEAARRLKIAMTSNIYLLPGLLGFRQEERDIWHSSNWEGPEYVDVVADVLPNIDDDERNWIQDQYESEPFRLVLSEYIAVYEALLHEKDRSRRGALLDRWYKFERRSLARGA